MRLSRSALALLAAVSLPALTAVAQQATQGPTTPAAGPTAGQRGPSPEMIARFQDGKLAAAKAMLRLTPEQEKLWAPVEQQIRADFAERTKLRAEHQAKRAERQAQRDEGNKGRGRVALPERLDKATELMSKRAERLKAFSTAVKPLYASLNDEQKLVANGVLGQFAGGGKGHRGGEHGGWGNMHGRHHGWGGMRAEGGPEGGGRGWGHHGGHGKHRGPMNGPMGGMGGDTGTPPPADGDKK